MSNVRESGQMSKDSVSVATPTVVYVLMHDRAAFDTIALPAVDRGIQPIGQHLVIKSMDNVGDNKRVTVIFQHWFEADPGAEHPNC